MGKCFGTGVLPEINLGGRNGHKTSNKRDAEQFVRERWRLLFDCDTCQEAQKILKNFATGRRVPEKEGTMNNQIENNFNYHAPKEGQTEKYAAIREKAKELAYLIDAECPSSREKSLAMTKLEETVMWANASIARN